MRDEPEKQLYYYELGEDYFWLAGHYDVSVLEFERHLMRIGRENGLGSFRVLDAGCGPGNLISRLKSRAVVFGSDFSEAALHFCLEKHRVPVFISNLESFSMKNNSLDSIISLEVIEHVERDRNVLKEFYRILKPGGFCIVSVPAFQILWSTHDEWFGHFRRYSRKELIEKVREAGFSVVSCNYFKCFLFFPMLVMRSVKKWFGLYHGKKDDFYTIPEWLNRLLRWMMVTEARWKINSKLPFGTNLLCVFEKPLERKFS